VVHWQAVDVLFSSSSSLSSGTTVWGGLWLPVRFSIASGLWPLQANFLYPPSSDSFHLHQSTFSVVFSFPYSFHFHCDCFGILSLFIFSLNWVILQILQCNSPCNTSCITLFVPFDVLMLHNIRNLLILLVNDTELWSSGFIQLNLV